MKKIAIMCDSSADISKEEAKELDLHVVRMPITIDQDTYIEAETITDEEIIKALREKKVVKTAQPVIGDVIAMWDELLKTHDEVFYLPISRELSGTCHTAISMAASYQGRVTVVDSTFVCYPIITIIKQIKEMFALGYSAQQVKEKVEQEAELFAILIPEDLTTLKNGGRISPAAAALAGLLKIQPLLKVEYGAIELVDKVRTLKKAYKTGLSIVLEGIDPNEYDWMIIDADNRSVSAELKQLLEEACGQPVQQKEFKSIIMSHTGVGTIGFGRIRKIKY